MMQIGKQNEENPLEHLNQQVIYHTGMKIKFSNLHLIIIYIIQMEKTEP